jgi:hypothetical protein
MSTEDEDIEVEVWDDPDWTTPLEQLCEKGNGAALAKVLRSGKEVPHIVAKELANMIDPPSAYRGPTLTLKISPKREARINEIVERYKIGESLRRSSKPKQREGEVQAIMDATGRGRTYVYDSLEWDLAKCVAEFEKLLGHTGS